MSYAPGIQDRRGEYLLAGMQQLGAGIGAFGSEVGEAIQKHQQERKKIEEEQNFNDMVLKGAIQSKSVDPATEKGQEFLTKWQKASPAARNGLAHGIIFNMAEDWQRQMQTEQQKHLQAQTSLAQQQAALYKSMANDKNPPFMTDPQTGITYRRGLKGESIPVAQGLQPQSQSDQAEKMFTSQMKARGLDPDIFTSEPKELGEEDTQKNVPYLNKDKSVYVWRGGKGNQVDDKNNPTQYTTMHPKVWGQFRNQYNQIYAGGQAEQAETPQAQSKPLDPATAQQILKQAGGDKAKARQIAKEQGYDF